MQKITDFLMKVAATIATNKILNIIQRAFSMLLPVSLLGALFALLNGITNETYQAFLASTGIGAIVSACYQFTVGAISLYVVFAIAYQYAIEYDMEASAVPVGLIAISCFLVVTPWIQYDANYSYTASIAFYWCGSAGMFSGIVLGFIVGMVFKFCVKYKITIKMPKQVPPMIAIQFSSLIPALFSIAVAGIIKYLAALTSASDIHTLLYAVVSMPLQSLGSNIWGFYIIYAACNVFWFFGIHGGMATSAISSMLFTQLAMENLTAYSAGQPLPNMVTGSALLVGTDCLQLLVAGLIVSKSKTVRSILNLGTVPAFFNISEPLVFGLPTVLNAYFFLPGILTPAIAVFGTYLLELAGFIGYPTCVSAGSFAPFFINSFLGWGWSGVIWGFVLFALCVLVYMPFIKGYDNQMLKEEALQEASEAQKD